MYCIYQIDESSNEKIIGNVESIHEFLPFINKSLSSIYSSYKIVAKVSSETINIDHSNYPDGYYLLHQDKMIQLIKKTENVSKGYLFTTVNYTTEAVLTWKLLESENMTLSEDSRTLKISEFEVNDLKNNASFLVLGNNKTFVVNYLLKRLSRTHGQILIMSVNEKLNKLYSSQFPQAKIISEYHKPTLDEYASLDNGCIVFDDFDSLSIQDDLISYHGKIPLIMTGHFWTRIKTHVIFDYMIFLKGIPDVLIKNFWHSHLSMFSDKQNLKRIFTTCTEDNCAMVIDNTHSQNKLEKRVFWSRFK